MKESIDQFNPTNSITLVRWDAAEIAQALRKLGADESTIAKATVSFLVKIPGAVVSRVEWGFQVGNSFLPESHIGVINAIEWTRNVFEILMKKGDAFAAANDTSHALAA
jgi:hypothetical protein